MLLKSDVANPSYRELSNCITNLLEVHCFCSSSSQFTISKTKIAHVFPLNKIK